MRINLNAGDTESSPSFVLLSIFMIAGVVVLGYGVKQYQGQTQNIQNSVNISATVIDTNIRTDSSRRGGVDYHAEISFDYSYEGENYSSGNIYPLDDDREFNQEPEAEEFLENYSEGEKIDAYVNPENPGGAFLRNRRSDQPLILLLIGGLMTLSAGYKTAKSVI